MREKTTQEMDMKQRLTFGDIDLTVPSNRNALIMPPNIWSDF